MSDAVAKWLRGVYMYISSQETKFISHRTSPWWTSKYLSFQWQRNVQLVGRGVARCSRLHFRCLHHTRRSISLKFSLILCWPAWALRHSATRSSLSHRLSRAHLIRCLSSDSIRSLIPHQCRQVFSRRYAIVHCLPARLVNRTRRTLYSPVPSFAYALFS